MLDKPIQEKEAQFVAFVHKLCTTFKFILKIIIKLIIEKGEINLTNDNNLNERPIQCKYPSIS